MEIQLKKRTAWLLMLAMLITMLPCFTLTASAAAVGDFTVEGGTENTDYTYADNVLTILTDTSLTISGTTTTGRIVIAENTTANLTIHNLSIDIQDGNVIDISSGSTLNLTLGGSNTLRPAGTKAGIHVPDGTTLKISGEGSLEVYGGRSGSDGGAAIGANQGGTLGIIEIQSGTITAKAASGGGAGIGMGGWGGSSTNASVTISGGYVTSTGAGSEGSFYGGTIAITGGVVIAPDTKLGSAEMSNCLVFQGNAGQVYGTVTLPKDFTVENEKSLTVPEGATLNTSSFTLTNNGIIHVVGTISGTLTNNGTIANGGTISGTLNNSGTIYQNGNATVPEGTAGTILTSGWPCGDLLVTGGKLDTDFSYANGVITILTSTQLTISGTTTANRIVVGDSVSANVILNGVSIAPAHSPFTIPSGASANITLAAGTTNTLKGGKATSRPWNKYAGLNVPSGAAVTINCGKHQDGSCNGGSGCGKLVATGHSVVATQPGVLETGAPAAGIGGNGGYTGSGQSAGVIIINGGNISATGGTMDGRQYNGVAAGIGGGGGSDASGGGGGTVTINGGSVTAVSGNDNGNGIGGGGGDTDSSDGAGGSLKITGGTLRNTSFAISSTNGSFEITGGTLTGCTLAGATASLNGGTVNGGTVQSNEVTANGGTITNLTIKSPNLTINGATFIGTTNIDSDVSITNDNAFGGTTNITGAVTIANDVSVNFSDKTTITGNIINNGAVSFSGNSSITGNITNIGTVSFSDISSIAGNVINSGMLICKENSNTAVSGNLENQVNAEIQILNNAVLTVFGELKNDGSISGAGTLTYYSYSGDGTNTVKGLEVMYLDANGSEKSQSVLILGNVSNLQSGWYVVQGELTVTDRITISGDVHLILANGAKLKAEKGIYVSKNNSFTVYAQSFDETLMGELTAKAVEGYAAGIGAGPDNVGGRVSGAITINGGRINASGSFQAAGIGSAGTEDAGTITINNGIVNATGGNGSPGIGSGNDVFADSFLGTVTINGGKVTAIGGNFRSTQNNNCEVGILAGTITITGGDVVSKIGTNGRYAYRNGSAPTIANTYPNAMIWYGENESAANTAGAKPTSDLANNHTQKYVRIAPAYTVSFNANGGTETMDSVIVIAGENYTLPECTFEAPTAKQFKGWATSADGEFISGGTIVITDNTTLYAIWENIPAVAPTLGSVSDLTGENALIYGEITADAKLTVAAMADSGAEYDLKYQWYKAVSASSKVGAEAITDETAASYAIPSDTAAGNYYYYCTVTATRTDNGESAQTETEIISVTVNTTEQAISFAESTVTKTYGDEPFTITANRMVGGGEVTYKSSNPDVAEVNPTTGEVTIKKVDAMPVTITATAKATDNYAEATATYSLKINQKPLTIQPKAVTVKVNAVVPTFELAYDGLVSSESLTPSVAPEFKLYKSDGTTELPAEEAVKTVGTYIIKWTNANDIMFTGGYENNYALTANDTANLVVESVDNGNGGSYTPPTYPPTVPESEGGDTTVSPRYPEQGDIVKITTNPDEGKEVDEVIVIDKDGNPVEVTDNGDGTYTFVQPRGRVTITVTYKDDKCEGTAEDNCPSLEFSDLDPAAWYHDGVDHAIENGLMVGTSTTENLFSPNGTTTRAQIVTILWRMEGEPVANYLMQFEDVDAEKWYTEAIRWAAANEIVLGYNGKFNPNDPITREQFAAILWRYAKYKGYDVSIGENTNILSYEDALTVSEYAVPAMQWVCGTGIIQGISSANGGMLLDPQGNAIRSQAATIMMRFDENVEK